MTTSTNETASPSLRGPFLLNAATIAILGILALYAASAIKASDLGLDASAFVTRQLLAAGLGVALIAVLQALPLVWLERSVMPLAIFSFLLLATILVPGVYHKVGGASRWIRLGPLTFQPSELTKLALVGYAAHALARGRTDPRKFFSLMPILGGAILTGGLLLLQPDFGTAALLAMTVGAMIYMSGASRPILMGLGGSAVCAAIVAVAIAPYRMKRLLTFLDPWAAAREGGFQILQSYLAFRNGGGMGVGLGASRQKLYFLPEAHTDFIFAVIGEELGLVGALVLIALIANMVRLGVKIAQKQRLPFHGLLAAGLSILIGLQSFFNIGVVMGILPTKGIPLPLISSGRSSLIASAVMIGILARLAHEVHDTRPLGSARL